MGRLGLHWTRAGIASSIGVQPDSANVPLRPGDDVAFLADYLRSMPEGYLLANGPEEICGSAVCRQRRTCSPLVGR